MSDTRNEPNNIDLASEVDGEDEGTSQGPIHLIPKIDLIPHTVFILCGPTSSGKSQFAEDISNLCESNILEVKVISSDAIRHRLLSESQVSPFGSANKYTDGMMTVSKQAFDLLMADYKAAISFPVSTPIVVLDTTGMDERFRETVLTMGKENGYKVILVTFEYKNRSDYFPETKTDVERAIIEKSVIKFRRKILPALKAKNFDARLRINSKLAFGWDIPREDTWWFEDSSTTWEEHAISDVAKQKRDLYDILNEDGDITVLDSSQVYAVIGDSHECVDELKQLIGLLPEGCVVVHVGDYLDKGGNTLEMVNYMYERHQKGDYILQGNHENYVYKRLRGQIEANEALEKDFFTSVTPLLENEEAREKFFSIFEQSYPFLVLNRFDIKGGLPVFISHAPCSNIHLGKVHDTALLAQRNYRVKDRTKPMVKDLAWLYKEAESIHPLHIFGHVTSIQTRVQE
jgi:predicted kinase